MLFWGSENAGASGASIAISASVGVGVGSVAFTTLAASNFWYTLLVLGSLLVEEFFAASNILFEPEMSDVATPVGVIVSSSGSSIATSGGLLGGSVVSVTTGISYSGSDTFGGVVPNAFSVVASPSRSSGIWTDSVVDGGSVVVEDISATVVDVVVVVDVTFVPTGVVLLLKSTGSCSIKPWTAP